MDNNEILQWRLHVQHNMGRLDSDMQTVKEEVLRMREDVTAIKEAVSQLRGGWKVVAIFGAVAATIGGLIVKFLSF